MDLAEGGLKSCFFGANMENSVILVKKMALVFGTIQYIIVFFSDPL